ncbi:MAG: DUF1800 domain-containing protein [Cognatishimia sp.]|uniref:DUF1800 domain-containing protein n=1 Tax=Cognatishimia sp. TaxID=2211648 RepID=UPI003B8DFA14
MFDPTLAEIRFGTGLSPSLKAPRDVSQMLAGIQGRDVMADRFPIEPYDTYRHRIRDYAVAQRAYRKGRGTEQEEQLKNARKKITRASRTAYAEFFRNAFLRRIHSETGFRERLAFFWQDHFTARGKSVIAKRATGPYVEEVIRPNIAGRFEDMLIAAVTHPVMLTYLDQAQSMGPNSKVAKRAEKRGRQRGLNENLAREVMELHTLGVSAGYSQADVRELAELFTGMSLNKSLLFTFKPEMSEPGAETVMGRLYSDEASFEPIKAALRDLARHPVTARHLAQKLARHFVSDNPEPDLVAAMEAAYVESGGQLVEVYTAMLAHPESWQASSAKVKKPFDFMATSLRALDVGGTTLARSRERDLRNILYFPMQIMGQPWQAPNGPDGWPEEGNHWITPQFMAARLQWALAAPRALRRTLPDPRTFAHAALGDRLPKDVRFAAEAAENRWEGIALVLTSPAFQRF